METNQLIGQIRVPKNMMYLTDRLPLPCYPSSMKNKSEANMRLPKLSGSKEDASST
jgi:hypothetical protein